MSAPAKERPVKEQLVSNPADFRWYERLAIRAMTLFAAFFARLPPPAFAALGNFLGWVFGSIIRYHRADAREALARCLPELPAPGRRKILRRMYRGLGFNALEMFCAAEQRPDDLIAGLPFDGREHVRAALARGKGLIILSGHVGNFDRMAIAAGLWGYPLEVITKGVKNRVMTHCWADTRKKFGVTFLPARQAYRTCLHRLRRNGVVGFMLDQNMIREEGVFVPFFGRLACTTPGLAYMAAQSGAPVVPAFIVRDPENPLRQRVQAFPPIEPPPDREPETIRAATEQYTKVLEDFIRAHPEQWIWIHRRWKTRPIEELGY